MPSSLLMLSALLSACGCILGTTGDKAVKEEPISSPTPGKQDARVAAAAQEKMTGMLKKDPSFTRALGLFSEGGWADAGQVMIFERKSGLPALRMINPGSEEITVERDLTDSEWSTLRSLAATGQNLADIDVTAFDALIFEFVIMDRTGDGETRVLKRLFVRNPGTKPMPEHQALIDAFQALRKPR